MDSTFKPPRHDVSRLRMLLLAVEEIANRAEPGTEEELIRLAAMYGRKLGLTPEDFRAMLGCTLRACVGLD